jgi:hypothetical protein
MEPKPATRETQERRRNDRRKDQLPIEPAAERRVGERRD